ncbi:hypothetical protein [Yoonia sp.]|uniref:hypothetical protein n=1 Tax=Yoonia sp. TaxID=2212373 RepID=UPI00358E36EB
MKRTTIAFGAVCFLGACMGSDGGAERFNTGDAAFDALGNRAIDVFDEFEALDSEEGFTPFTAVAAEEGGSAIYNGVATVVAGTFDEETDTETVDYLAVGSFTVTADFGIAQSVTGTADGFFEIANPEVANDENSELTDAVNAGAIEGSFAFDLDIYDLGGDAAADGDVTGSITTLDDTEIALTETTAFGDFYGNDLDALSVDAGTEEEGNRFIEISATGLR